MKRVLQLPDSIEKRNGRMSVIMSVYRKIDKSKVQFDFLATDYGFDNYYDEIKKLGGHVFLLPHKNLNQRNIVSIFKNVIHNGNYDYLHYHALSKWGICVPIANKKGIKTIIHSHATKLSSNTIKSVRNRIYYWIFLRHSYKRVAISPEAGKKLFLSKEYIYIPNMVNFDRFKFDEKNRRNIREQYSISKRTIVIGMVGRVSKQKNILFALKAFNYLIQRNDNYRLMIVGQKNVDNIDRNYHLKLLKYIENHNLSNRVIFTDMVLNVNEYYSAFDVFWMTSFFEGMPTSAIEAQANGLSLILSDRISRSTNITNNLKFLSIHNKDIERWSQITLQDTRRITNSMEFIRRSDFNTKHVISEWMSLYGFGSLGD